MPPFYIRAAVCITFFSTLLAAAQGVAAPKALVEPTSIHLGTIRSGEVATSHFAVSNTGDAPLEITQIQMSCKCIVVEGPPEPVIAPGQSMTFAVAYDSESRHGDLAGTVVLYTNEQEARIHTVDLQVTVKALIVTNPENAVVWGLAPRGHELSKELSIRTGDQDVSLEVIGVHTEEPGIHVKHELSQAHRHGQVKFFFTLDSTLPLGEHENRLIARLRVGEEEVEVKMPLKGTVVGDVLVMPPLIFSPKIEHKPGQRISEIYVRSSAAAPPPKVLGVLAVGPLRAEVQAAPEENRYVLPVYAAENLPPGARSGTIYVMTESKDEPIVGVPVYFQAGKALQPSPDRLVFSLADGVPPAQRVEIPAPEGRPFAVKDVRYEQDLLTVNVVTPAAQDGAPAVIEVIPTGLADPARAAAMIIVVTDCPNAEEFLVPVLLRP